MGAEAERSSRRWKWVAVASLLVAAGSFAALAAIIALPTRTARVTDSRLIGSWQSDADRTIAGIRERKPTNDKQEAALRTLFGKLRVTYTPTTLTTRATALCSV